MLKKIADFLKKHNILSDFVHVFLCFIPFIFTVHAGTHPEILSLIRAADSDRDLSLMFGFGISSGVAFSFIFVSLDFITDLIFDIIYELKNKKKNNRISSENSD